MNLSNKVCLITGASRGVGLGVAKGFARRGAKVAAGCRSEKDAARLRDVDLFPVRLDVTNAQQIKEAVETVFDVTVERVRTINMPAKRARRYGRRTVVRKPGWKKAIVTLAPGDRIEFFEGV